MIDHLGIRVLDYGRSKDFYLKALAPIGYSLQAEYGPVGGLGPKGKPYFWLTQGEPSKGVHIGFMGDRRQVDAFFEAALAAGGLDNGPPGLRPEYHKHYYGAFVLDPDGNNVEVVCHTADGKLPMAATNGKQSKAKAKPKVKPRKVAARKKPAKAAKKKAKAKPKAKVRRRA